MPFRLTIALAMLAVSSVAKAELILDDFEGAASWDVASLPPDRCGGDSSPAGAVGDGELLAQRLFTYGCGGVERLEASLDAGETTASTLAMHVERLDLRTHGYAALGVTYRYDVIADLTRDAEYDAIRIELAPVPAGAQAPTGFPESLGISVGTASGIVNLTRDGLDPVASGQSLLFPFDQFMARESLPGLADFSQVSELRFLFYLRDGIEVSEASLLFGVDRIVLANSALPEPHAALLAFLGLSMLSFGRPSI